MSTKEYVDQFMAISYLYFQLTDKTSADITLDEMEDLLEMINAGNYPTSCPDQYVA
jgi:hypothetical protein